jgi:hypothetical protein
MQSLLISQGSGPAHATGMVAKAAMAQKKTDAENQASGVKRAWSMVATVSQTASKSGWHLWNVARATSKKVVGTFGM